MRSKLIVGVGVLITVVIALVRSMRGSLFLSYDVFPSLADIFLVPLSILCLVVLSMLIVLVEKKFNWPWEGVVLAVFSPAFLLQLLVYPLISEVIAILVLCIVLFWEHDKLLLVIAIGSFAIPTALPLTLYLTCILLIRKSWMYGLLSGILSICSAVLWGLPEFSFLGFVELGNVYSISLFYLLLAVMGILFSWKKQHAPYILGVCILLLLSSILPTYILGVSILIGFLAGTSIHVLRSSQWTLHSVQDTSVLLAFCGVLFALLVSVAGAIQFDEYKDFENIPLFLESLPPGKVLVFPEHEDIVKKYSLSYVFPSEEATSYRNAERILSYLPQYIILHEDDEADNLYFIIENTDEIVLVYEGTYSLYVVTKNIHQ